MITLTFKIGDTIRLKKDSTGKFPNRNKAKVLNIDNTCYKIEVINGVNRGAILNLWHQNQEQMELV